MASTRLTLLALLAALLALVSFAAADVTIASEASSDSSASASEVFIPTTPDEIVAATITFTTTITGEQLVTAIIQSMQSNQGHHMNVAAATPVFLISQKTLGKNNQNQQTYECVVGFTSADTAQAVYTNVVTNGLPGVSSISAPVIVTTTTTAGTGTTTTTAVATRPTTTTLHPFLSAADGKTTMAATVVAVVAVLAASL